MKWGKVANNSEKSTAEDPQTLGYFSNPFYFSKREIARYTVSTTHSKRQADLVSNPIPATYSLGNSRPIILPLGTSVSSSRKWDLFNVFMMV